MNVVGSYTVPVEPDAENYRVENLAVMASERALDGTLHSTYAAMKRRWQVSWSGLTATQRDSLMTQLRTQAHINLQPPEGGSYTVQVADASWELSSGAKDRYTVSARFEEQ